MMAKKAELFGDEDMKKKIMAEHDPAVHQKHGRHVKNFVSATWDANCLKIVKEASYAKFSQDERLKKQILETGNKTLVEASPKDKIWGIGLAPDDPNARDRSKWQGTNLLGVALMDARKRIMEEEATKTQ